jgi:hypothetical protein
MAAMGVADDWRLADGRVKFGHRPCRADRPLTNAWGHSIRTPAAGGAVGPYIMEDCMANAVGECRPGSWR